MEISKMYEEGKKSLILKAYGCIDNKTHGDVYFQGFF